MTKPTEGPYRAEGANIYGGDGWTIGITTGLARQAAANARLLAASWEMREALDEALDMMDFPPGSIGDEFVRDARALLARIDGDTE